MKAKLTTKFKILVSNILPYSEKLNYLVALPKLNKFHKQYKKTCKFLEKRTDLYDYLNHLTNNGIINYCEFGVYKGKSINYWRKINTNDNSLFIGFDTFTGLPENWDNFTGGLKKGTFDTDGKIPQIEDSRVSFHKGLFQESLPPFLDQFKKEGILIINIDADLYSSTLFVLASFHKFLEKGSIIIFDEFSSILHEFRAFEDYCSAFNVKFEVLAATRSDHAYYAHVAVRIL